MKNGREELSREGHAHSHPIMTAICGGRRAAEAAIWFYAIARCTLRFSGVCLRA